MESALLHLTLIPLLVSGQLLGNTYDQVPVEYDDDPYQSFDPQPAGYQPGQMADGLVPSNDGLYQSYLPENQGFQPGQVYLEPQIIDLGPQEDGFYQNLPPPPQNFPAQQNPMTYFDAFQPPSPQQSFLPEAGAMPLEQGGMDVIYDNFVPADLQPNPYGYNDLNHNENYFTPCQDPIPTWDTICPIVYPGDVRPYCDESTCIGSCWEVMGLPYGKCINNECFCEDYQQTFCTKDVCTASCNMYLNKPIGICQDNACFCDDNENNNPPPPGPNGDCGVSTKRFNNVKPKDMGTVLRLENYDKMVGLLVERNDNGVRIFVQTPEMTPSLDIRGILDGRYTLSHIDLRWSEHEIDNAKADLEMHLFHFDQSFGTYQAARSTEDATVVLALLFKINSDESDVCKSITNAIESLTPNGPGKYLLSKMAHLKFIKEKGKPFYYTYYGNEAEPPCPKTTWLVSSTFFNVSPNQIEQLKEAIKES